MYPLLFTLEVSSELSCSFDAYLWTLMLTLSPSESTVLTVRSISLIQEEGKCAQYSHLMKEKECCGGGFLADVKIENLYGKGNHTLCFL